METRNIGDQILNPTSNIKLGAFGHDFLFLVGLLDTLSLDGDKEYWGSNIKSNIKY